MRTLSTHCSRSPASTSESTLTSSCTPDSNATSSVQSTSNDNIPNFSTDSLFKISLQPVINGLSDVSSAGVRRESTETNVRSSASLRSASSDSCFSQIASDEDSTAPTRPSSAGTVDSPMHSPKPEAAVTTRNIPASTGADIVPASPDTSAYPLYPQPINSVTSSSLSSALRPADWEIASQRIRPTVTSSYFRPYAKFVGTQKSKDSRYKVEVELKYVDMSDSFCCGYLKIEGLTKELPTMQTYFEGEIIGTKYSFQTDHENWGASEKQDMDHWSRFPAFAPLKPAAKQCLHHDPDFATRDHLFMRWKEQFLVPNHRQRDLPGASFEGFYYVVFDQRSGAISGIYFHAKSGSDRVQELELKPACQSWCPPAVEFR